MFVGVISSDIVRSAESQPIGENDRLVKLLESFESNYRGYHLITGSLGLMGALGNETRVCHDLDVCIPRPDETNAAACLQALGFNRLSPEQTRHLHNNGMMFQNAAGIKVDVWFGDFTSEGLALNNPDGLLFIPKDGLDYEVSLRGIKYKTLSPEVHYLFKDRAIRRNPFQTLSPMNREKDKDDYNQLKLIISANKVQSLLDKGFSYKGKHPMPRILAEKVSDFVKGITRGINPEQPS